MRQRLSPRTIVLAAMIFLGSIASAQDVAGPVIPKLQISRADRLDVFNKAWETVNKHFFDPKFSGVDWVQMKEKYQPLVEAATDKAQLRDVLNRMVSLRLLQLAEIEVLKSSSNLKRRLCSSAPLRRRAILESPSCVLEFP